MIVDTESFVEIECKTAEQLIENLTKTNPAFAGAEDVRLFRGESDISRPLIPSAFREKDMRKLIELNNIEVRGAYVECKDETKHLGNWFHEKMAVALFYKHANEQGLPLPPVSSSLHAELLGRTNDMHLRSSMSFLGWPQEELWPIIALAQHYGFPTRLLDWSGDALASAYFAASRGIRYKDVEGRKIGVWSTHSSLLLRTVIPYNLSNSATSSCYVTIVDAPYAGNPNLAAQKGRFTLTIGDTTATSLDKVVQKIFQECETKDLLPMLILPDDFHSSQAFVKYSLPASESVDLLNRLHQLGYKASRFFPGYASCIATVDELLSIRKYKDYAPRT